MEGRGGGGLMTLILAGCDYLGPGKIYINIQTLSRVSCLVKQSSVD